VDAPSQQPGHTVRHHSFSSVLANNMTIVIA
jgi:hypothetical protein